MAAMNWDAAFKEIIGHEGGLSLDPNDPGNWTGGKVNAGRLNGTKFGISAASYPHIDIKALHISDAKAIYRRDFWGQLRCDALPSGIDLVVFDLGVNGGTGRGAGFLQKAVGVNVDGQVGPITTAAAERADPAVVINKICDMRLAEMRTFKTWPRYGGGWTSRVEKIRATAKAWSYASTQPGPPDIPIPEPSPSGPPISWWRRLISNFFGT